jgi:hypothetical protein
MQDQLATFEIKLVLQPRTSCLSGKHCFLFFSTGFDLGASYLLGRCSAT